MNYYIIRVDGRWYKDIVIHGSMALVSRTNLKDDALRMSRQYAQQTADELRRNHDVTEVKIVAVR